MSEIPTKKNANLDMKQEQLRTGKLGHKLNQWQIPCVKELNI